MKEADLEKRRKEAEELLKWHERLKQEEVEVAELERQAAKSIQTDEQEKTRVLTGAQLNKIWRGITGSTERKFDEQKKYQMSKRSLDKFYQNARKIFKEVSEERRKSKQTSEESYSSEFDPTNSTSKLDSIVTQINETDLSIPPSNILTNNRLRKISELSRLNLITSNVSEHSTLSDKSQISSDNRNYENSALIVEHNSESPSKISTELERKSSDEEEINEKLSSIEEAAEEIINKTGSEINSIKSDSEKVQDKSKDASDLNISSIKSVVSKLSDSVQISENLASEIPISDRIVVDSDAQIIESFSKKSIDSKNESQIISEPDSVKSNSISEKSTSLSDKPLTNKENEIQVGSTLIESLIIQKSVDSGSVPDISSDTQIKSKLSEHSKTSKISSERESIISDQDVLDSDIKSDFTIESKIVVEISSDKIKSENTQSQINSLEELDEPSHTKSKIESTDQISENNLHTDITSTAKTDSPYENDFDKKSITAHTSYSEEVQIESKISDPDIERVLKSDSQQISTIKSDKVSTEKEEIETDSPKENRNLNEINTHSNSEIKTNSISPEVLERNDLSEIVSEKIADSATITEKPEIPTPQEISEISDHANSDISKTEDTNDENEDTSFESKESDSTKRTENSKINEKLSQNDSDVTKDDISEVLIHSKLERDTDSNKLETNTEGSKEDISVTSKTDNEIKSLIKSDELEVSKEVEEINDVKDDTSGTLVHSKSVNNESNSSKILENNKEISKEEQIITDASRKDSDTTIKSDLSEVNKEKSDVDDSEISKETSKEENYTSVHSKSVSLKESEVSKEKSDISKESSKEKLIEKESDSIKELEVSNDDSNLSRSPEISKETSKPEDDTSINSKPEKESDSIKEPEESDNSLEEILSKSEKDSANQSDENEFPADEIFETSRKSSNTSDASVAGVSHIDVRKRVSEILADATSPRGDKSPRLQDLYVTAYDVTATSAENTPESGSPTNEFSRQERPAFITETPYRNEAEELLRKQLEIEQEIKQLERQQQNIPYLFMREIPNKPPPPYKPPEFPLAPVVANIIPVQPDQAEKLITEANHVLYSAYKKGTLQEARLNPINEVKEDSQKFMFDLCKEIALEVCKPTTEIKVPSWRSQKNKFQSLFSKRPMSKGGLNNVLHKKVLQLLNLEPVVRNDSLIIRWSRKKRDHVDEILVSETQAEEAEWTNFDSDEEVIKDNLTRDILDMLIVDTAKSVSDILNKKKNLGWSNC